MLLLSPGWATSRQAVWRSLLLRITRLVGLSPGIAVHPLDQLSENQGRVEMQTAGRGATVGSRRKGIAIGSTSDLMGS